MVDQHAAVSMNDREIAPKHAIDRAESSSTALRFNPNILASNRHANIVIEARGLHRTGQRHALGGEPEFLQELHDLPLKHEPFRLAPRPPLIGLMIT